MPDSHDERIARLWVAAADACLKSCKLPGPERALARLVIDRDAPGLHRYVTAEEQARAVAWIEALFAEARPLGNLGAAAVLWAAVCAWNDLGGDRWQRFAEVVSRLACAVEPEGSDDAALAEGDRLCRVMAERAEALWARRAA